MQIILFLKSLSVIVQLCTEVSVFSVTRYFPLRVWRIMAFLIEYRTEIRFLFRSLKHCVAASSSVVADVPRLLTPVSFTWASRLWHLKIEILVENLPHESNGHCANLSWMADVQSVNYWNSHASRQDYKERMIQWEGSGVLIGIHSMLGTKDEKTRLSGDHSPIPVDHLWFYPT